MNDSGGPVPGWRDVDWSDGNPSQWFLAGVGETSMTIVLIDKS